MQNKSLDHIGSTSVPGLAAKDVIDLQITVSALNDSLAASIASLGYVKAEYPRDYATPGFTGPDSEWEKMFFGPPPRASGGEASFGLRRTHIHVRVQGRANQRYALLFRDYLRAHPATAEASAELKRRLAQYLADPQDYPFVKDPAVDLIYFAAEAWAASGSWQPGSPDA